VVEVGGSVVGCGVATGAALAQARVIIEDATRTMGNANRNFFMVPPSFQECAHPAGLAGRPSWQSLTAPICRWQTGERLTENKTLLGLELFPKTRSVEQL
jgi:hypothetical protein